MLIINADVLEELGASFLDCFLTKERCLDGGCWKTSASSLTEGLKNIHCLQNKFNIVLRIRNYIKFYYLLAVLPGVARDKKRIHQNLFTLLGSFNSPSRKIKKNILKTLIFLELNIRKKNYFWTLLFLEIKSEHVWKLKKSHSNIGKTNF